MKSKDLYKILFNEEQLNEKYSLVGHRMVFNSRVGKSVCDNCGLVGLRNTFTDWSIKMGCLSHLHPSYKNMSSKTRSF